MDVLIYDIEIKKAIPGNNDPLPGVQYCEGWHDHHNMGIACIGAYDYLHDRYRVFMDDNLEAFRYLIGERPLIVSFNGLAFDNKVCAANGVDVPDVKSYDLLVEIWRAAGLGPKFVYPTHAGFGLEAMGRANFGRGKTGNGAFAPVNYQRKEFGTLIDYCLNDVALTKRLFDQVMASTPLRNPNNMSQTLILQRPYI